MSNYDLDFDRAKSFMSLADDFGLDRSATMYALLAFHRWDTGNNETENWTKCSYPGGVIEAVSAYVKAAPSKKIVKLKWESYEEGDYLECFAPTTGKIYTIGHEGGKYFALWDANIPGSENLEEIQDIAQADFEAEVMKAFE